MEYEVKEKQLENPTPSAPSGTPKNFCPQMLSNNNCQLYDIFKEFVSSNRDMTSVLLNEVDKPIKFIDFQYEGIKSRLYDLKVFVNLEYYMSFKILIDYNKCFMLKTRHCTGFKFDTFVNGSENRIFRIKYKTTKPIYKKNVKISIV